jgi:hypothetical protein
MVHQSINTTIPMAWVPACIGITQAAASRLSRRERWALIDTPGLKRFKHVSVALLERRFGIAITGADIDRAARLHAAELRKVAVARIARRHPTAAETLGLTQRPLEDQPKRFSSGPLRA